MLLIPPFKSINTEEENFPCDGNHVSFQAGLTVLQKKTKYQKKFFFTVNKHKHQHPKMFQYYMAQQQLHIENTEILRFKTFS